MNKILRLLLAALVCAGALQAQETTGASKPLRVVFWNLEWFPGARPNATVPEAVTQISRTIPALARLDADIIGMEEVLNWDAAAIALAQTPGTSVQVASEFLDEQGVKTAQQLVIASRLPALGAWWELWKAGRSLTPKRGFSFAAYQPAPGQMLLVYCVHLKSNRGELSENVPMREESARQLLAHVAAMESAYAPLGTVSVVIGGDFNTSQDDPKFQTEQTLTLLTKAGFRSAWENVPFASRVTLPSKPSNNPKYPPFPDACFDHVFVKGAKVLGARVETFDPAPSDHRPVIVEIALPESQQ
jgi:endonuclease/exonuclease/phosphatase family metal-dependent hydrolase